LVPFISYGSFLQKPENPCHSGVSRLVLFSISVIICKKYLYVPAKFQRSHWEDMENAHFGFTCVKNF
jgi:hypothetical protein